MSALDLAAEALASARLDGDTHTVEPLPGWTLALMDLCAGRCGDYGEPACWRLDDISPDPRRPPITPCDACLRGDEHDD